MDAVPRLVDEAERLNAGRDRPLQSVTLGDARALTQSDESVEIVAAGFDVVAVYGVEGPARMFADFETRWADARQRADLLRIAALVEAEPSLSGLSGHLLTVARPTVAA